MQFDWTITLGNLLSTVIMLVAFVGGAYRFIMNHLQHFEDRISIRFDAVDKDIRELRDWTIVMRSTKRTRAN